MELDEALRGRRSIRRFTDEAVSMDLVRQILEAGTWAPSAKNGQQWRFTVLTGTAKSKLTDFFRHQLEIAAEKTGRGELGSSFPSCGIMEKAPVLIIVWNAGGMGWESEIHSVAAAIQNILLKGHSLGLGTLWIADVLYTKAALERYFRKPWKLTAAIAVGWPAEEPMPKPRKSVDEVAEFLA